MHQEEQYLQLIRDVLEKDTMEEGRNGYTKSLFGYSMFSRTSYNKNFILLTSMTSFA